MRAGHLCHYTRRGQEVRGPETGVRGQRSGGRVNGSTRLGRVPICPICTICTIYTIHTLSSPRARHEFLTSDSWFPVWRLSGTVRIMQLRSLMRPYLTYGYGYSRSSRRRRALAARLVTVSSCHWVARQAV